MALQRICENTDSLEKSKHLDADLGLVESRLFVLRPGDQQFMKLCVHYGMSITRIAQLTRMHPNTVSHRLMRIRNLLLNREFLMLYATRKDMSEQEQKMAYDHLVNNLGYRSLAKKYNASERQVRKFLARCKHIKTASTRVKS